jgi:hypothetical protein
METKNKWNREWAVTRTWNHWIAVITELEFRTCNNKNPPILFTIAHVREREIAHVQWCSAGEALVAWLTGDIWVFTGRRGPWGALSLQPHAGSVFCLQNTTKRHRLLLLYQQLLILTLFLFTATLPVFSFVLSCNANPLQKNLCTGRFSVVPCNPC